VRLHAPPGHEGLVGPFNRALAQMEEAMSKPMTNLVDALVELTEAYDEGEPDRCAGAIQPVLDAFAPIAAERPLHMVVDMDDEQAYGPFTIAQAIAWLKEEVGDPTLTDAEAEDELGCAPYMLVTWEMPAASWPGYESTVG